MISDNFKKRTLSSFLLLIGFFLIFHSNFFLIYTLIVFGTLSIVEYLNLTKKIFKNKLFSSFLNTFFIIYVSIFCFFFFFFSNFTATKLILFIITGSCFASDIGGYIIGNILKGPKLTKVSPNKTISGCLGSFVFSCITFSVLIFIFLGNFNVLIILVGLIISLACQSGDLFFSFLKRKAKIKDTGFLIPGHGGVLDRIDGVLLGLPLGLIATLIIF